MSCLATSGLRHRYRGGEPVLGGIDLEVAEGSIYGFLGPNGAGKTTTLRLVLGLLSTQLGTITIFGQRLDANRREILRRVGSLIESPSVYGHLTATENLEVLRKVYRCPQHRIPEVLELVGLADTARKKTGDFSLGMKQRMGLAMALLHAPSLLILDEPTNGLDPNGIIEMRQLLTRLNREQQVTVVVSSHLLAEVEKLATHVGIIDRGRMLFQGTLEELKRKQRQLQVIRIGTNDDERALQIIAAFAPGVERAAEGLVVPVTSRELAARINRRLVEAGLEVHEIHAIGNDLEAIFMGLLEGRES